MKPFNLQEAIAGKPLVTRDGRDAKFIAHVPESVCSSRVIILVGNSIYVFYEDGTVYAEEDSGCDLFMGTVKKTIYANLFQAGIWNGFENEKDAIREGNSSISKPCAIAVPIEIEE